MYIIRDCFHLLFGRFKDAKALLDEAMQKGMMPDAAFNKVYTDFTGSSYRLIFEGGYDTLADYEKSMAGGMAKPEWQEWYGRFKELVKSSHREILKQVI